MRFPRTVTALLASSPSWWPVRALGLALLLIGALGLTLGLRGTASDQSSAPLRLQALAQRAGPLVVFSEFGPTADTLWAANPDDPSDRVQLGRVDHAQDYGILPTLSPDGAYIAYTVLPAAPSSAGPAELWLLETADGATRRLAGGVDLRIAPVWSPTSDAVVVRRSMRQADGSSQLQRIDLAGRAVPITTASSNLYPIDISPDGTWLYYAALSPSGTDLARAPALGGGEAEVVAHLSDGFARDWHLSPDGTQLAYLGQVPVGGGFTFVAQVLDISMGQVRTPLGRDGVAQFNPVWERGGGLTIGRLAGAPLRLTANGTIRTQATLPPPSSRDGGTGFDVPLAWSPDGAHLAVRSFERSSLANPGPSHVVVAGTDGRRRELSPVSDIVVAGWLEATP